MTVADQVEGTGSYAASYQSVQEAVERIKPHIHHTPVHTCDVLNTTAKRQLFFKCEIFQRSGSFKFRGACNAVLSLSKDQAAKGVVTHSSGNHAAALALAAQVRGIAAYIVVPSTTPQCKVKAVETYGGCITFCEPTMDAREAACAELQAATGAAFIPPYNHSDVISGQGTIAVEFLKQVPELDVIVVPVSGGGMISGICVAAKAIKPTIKVVAAEPCGTHGNAADVAASKAAGSLVPCPRPNTIADGLQGRLGNLTWPIVRDYVDAVITVTEAEIVSAMQLVYENMKLVVEPSGAVGVAAVLTSQFESLEPLRNCERVGVILCGGNVDLGVLWESFTSGTRQA